MKKMSMYFASATCAVMASLAAIAATYDYSEEGGKALVVTVGSGDEDYLSDDAVAKLNANDVTNLYKRGDGRLVITNNTSSYTGHFWIQDGILTSKPVTGVSLSGNDNLTMGKVPASGEDVAGCGAIHVCNGASFTLDCRGVSSAVAANLRLQNKTTYFEGFGHNNLGALTILSGENNGAGPVDNNFGGRLRMTGNATIRNNINNWMGFNNYRYLYMNGHTLTFEGASVGVFERLEEAYDFGDVIVKYPCLTFNNTMWFGTSAADSNHTMRVKGNAYIRINDRENDTYDGCVKAAYGTLHLEDGSYIRLSASNRRNVMGPAGMEDLNFPSPEYNDYRSNNNWMGPVMLDTPDRILIAGDTISGASEAWNGRYFQIGGKISGGGIRLDRNVRLVMRKHIDAPNDFAQDVNANDFTNGIFAAMGADVTLEWGNLLPTNGINSALVLSNASLTVKNDKTFTLPHVKCYGDCYFLGKMDNAWSPGYLWDSTAGITNRYTRQYYPSMEFVRDDEGECCGNFSTNVTVSSLSGLPEIAAYPADADANPVRPCAVTSTGPAMFQVIDTWNINVSDAAKGGCLSFHDGTLRFGHKDRGDVYNIAININCDVPDTTTPVEYKIAEADSVVFNEGFNPRTDVTFTGSDRWRFKVGEDGKSLYLVFRPANGFILTFK